MRRDASLSLFPPRAFRRSAVLFSAKNILFTFFFLWFSFRLPLATASFGDSVW